MRQPLTYSLRHPFLVRVEQVFELYVASVGCSQMTASACEAEASQLQPVPNEHSVGVIISMQLAIALSVVDKQRPTGNVM